MTEHYKYLCSFVLSRVHNFSDAEDIVQETYLTAILKKDTLRDESRCRAWLAGIAENKIRQYFRRQAVRAARFASMEDNMSAEPSASDETDDALASPDELHRLEDAVMALPDTWRQCAVVNLLCGFSGAETAEILGVPPQTVYNRTHQAKKALREKLGGIMEISMEKFNLMLKEGMTEVGRVCMALRDLVPLAGAGKYEEAAAALLTAPVLAADSAEAHKQIVQEIILAIRIMRLPEDHIVMRKLIVFGEQEIRLIEKLGVEDVLQSDSGEPFEPYEFYNDFADFYSAAGMYERAYAYCEKAWSAGETSKMRYAMILDDEGRYSEAIAVYEGIAARDDCTPSGCAMAYNRISNCLHKLGEHEKAYTYQLRNIELIRSGAVYAVDSEPYGNFLAGEMYYLAQTCARLGRKDEMLEALRACTEVNRGYREWAKAHSEFRPYKDDPAFIEICGTGEGSLGMIR